MLTFRAANSTLILLSAVATVLLTAFAPGPFSLGGTALARELSANFRVTGYGQTWITVAWEVPQGRGITNYTLQKYESDGSTTPWDRSGDETSGGYFHFETVGALEPDTQYSFVLRLEDDSGTTIIEASVSARTLPTPDPSDPTDETSTPDPNDPTDETPTPDPSDPTDETPTPDPNDPTDETPTPDPNISTDATLSSLSLSGIDFSPSFSPGRYHYDASVAKDVTETTVTAMPDKPEASYVIKLNGEVKADGFVPLSVGSSVITIEVTAEDGITSQTYTVAVLRRGVAGELPTDDPPVNFRVTGYDQTWITLAWEVPQGRGITNYTLQKYESDGSTTPWDRSGDETSGGYFHFETVGALEPGTQYSFVLKLKNDSGTTIIEALVSARTLPTPNPSDPTDKTPTPNPGSTNATLSSLTLSGIYFGHFDDVVTSYSAQVSNNVAQTTVKPTPNRSGASYIIKLNGEVKDDGFIPLSVGSNVITIEVTAEDGSTSQTYTVIVTRAAPTQGTPTPDPDPKPTVELDGISSSHDSVRENDGRATTITLTVTLDKTAKTDETITLAIVSPTQGKTAQRGEDFDATIDETITIAKDRIKGTAQLTLTPKDNETADGDKAFGVQATSSSGHQALINIKIYDDDIDGEAADGKEEDDEKPFAFAEAVKDQAYTVDSAITALELPEATGGEGEVTYSLSALPAGLTFNAATRTISGTPEAATDAAVEVTYTAQDSTGATISLTFSIAVNPPLNFDNLFDLFDLLDGEADEEDTGGG